ncbi:hypothetical protein OG900_06755 [Streptomyces sp. NBC_00433]
MGIAVRGSLFNFGGTVFSGGTVDFEGCMGVLPTGLPPQSGSVVRLAANW